MPWGDNTKGNNQGPWGSIPPKEPPEMEDFLKRGQENFHQFFSNFGGKKSVALLLLVLLVLWMATGIYEIDADEQGVVLRFGKYHRVEDPGLNYRIPSPVETVIKVPVTKIFRTEVGVRTGASGSGRGQERKMLEESLMLTGDENIVDIDFEVQWRVGDAANFLFNVDSPEMTVKSVAESAMREVIGRTPISDAFTEGRLQIEQQVEQIMQTVLDSYGAGVMIERVQIGEAQPPAAVIDAFRDVQTARADMERARNEAETYRNDVIPRARGESEKIIQGAEAYKQEVIARAEGQAARFLSVYEQYKNAKDVTRKRIYLETMEEILAGMDKILIDDTGGASGVVPYLPLNEINKRLGR